MWRKMMRDEQGQALNEYIFLVGILTLGIMAGLMIVNSAVNAEFQQLRGIVDVVAAANPGSTGNAAPGDTDQTQNSHSGASGPSAPANGNQGNGNQGNGNQGNGKPPKP